MILYLNFKLVIWYWQMYKVQTKFPDSTDDSTSRSKWKFVPATELIRVFDTELPQKWISYNKCVDENVKMFQALVWPPRIISNVADEEGCLCDHDQGVCVVTKQMVKSPISSVVF